MHLDPARMRTWFGDPPRSDPPDVPGYVLVSHERFSITSGSIVGFVLLPVWAFLIIGAVALLGGRSEYGANFDVWTMLLGAVVALLLVPLVHELIHGATGVAFGVRPSYGIGPGFAFTTFHEPMRRTQYLAVGLAPLVVITSACILLAIRFDAIAGWLIFAGVMNAGGAVGDLWMSWRIIRQQPTAIYYDLADGFAVLVPDKAVE